MSDSFDRQEPGCAGCGACDAGEGAPSHEAPPVEPERWPVLASVGFFLVPALLAVVGAVLGVGEPVWQLVGAVAGLAAGTGLVVVAARWLAR